MSKIKTIKSSLITWNIMEGKDFDDFKQVYCADGDGILQLIERRDGSFDLVDQLEVVKTWDDVDGFEEFLIVLENAQKYLAATYHEIFEDAMHWENPLTREDYNAFAGYGHLD